MALEKPARKPTKRQIQRDSQYSHKLFVIFTEGSPSMGKCLASLIDQFYERVTMRRGLRAARPVSVKP
jgi:hypothetical protein